MRQLFPVTAEFLGENADQFGPSCCEGQILNYGSNGFPVKAISK